MNDTNTDNAQPPAPRLTIGLPVYNGERFVSQAIECMLGQTFGDFELVISDNGSTDGTPAICRKFAAEDSRVRYYREEQNRGLVWNWNRVATLARGQYFKWLAHDDLYSADYLERCIGVLDAEPGVAYCHSQTGLIDEGGKLIAANPATASPSDAARARNQAQTQVTLSTSERPSERFGAALTRDLLSDILAVFRTDVLRATKLHPMYYGGDKVLLAQISLLGRYHEIPEPLIFIRRHSGQAQWLPSRRAHHEMMTGRPAGLFVMPRQVRCTLAYFNLALTARVSAREKMLCLREVLRFALKAKKWKRLVVDALRSLGVRIRVPEDEINPKLC